MLMGRTFSRPERMRMFFRQYLNELEQLGTFAPAFQEKKALQN